MKAQIDVEKVIRELAENTQSAAWVLEPREPPTQLSRYLRSLEDCPRCIPMDSIIIIREREPTPRPPNTSVWKVTPGE